jgi:hypothetical protein
MSGRLYPVESHEAGSHSPSRAANQSVHNSGDIRL